MTTTKRNIVAYILLFFYLLTSYAVVATFMPDAFIAAEYRSIVKLALNLNICFVIILGAFIIRKLDKSYFAYIAPLTLIALSLLLYVTDCIAQIAIAFMASTVFALSVLVFFRYFWKHTNSVERARLAGIIAFSVLPFFFVLDLLPGDSLSDIYFVMFWIALNLMILGIIFLLRTRPQIQHEPYRPNNNKVFEKSVIILYMIPWVLFTLINTTLAKDYPVITNSSFHILVGLQVIGANSGAILAGFLSDFHGRKIALALSLTLNGASTVIAGIFSSQAAFSAMFFTSGLAWGMLFVLYFFVIFGDLSNEENSQKIYAIGLVPYFLSVGIGQIYQPFLPVIVSLMVTCLALFLAIIPIIVAPELLVSDLKEKRKMANYVKRIKKIQKDQG